MSRAPLVFEGSSILVVSDPGRQQTHVGMNAGAEQEVQKDAQKHG